MVDPAHPPFLFWGGMLIQFFHLYEVVGGYPVSIYNASTSTRWVLVPGMLLQCFHLHEVADTGHLEDNMIKKNGRRPLRIGVPGM